MTKQQRSLAAIVATAVVVGGGALAVRVRAGMLSDALREAILSNNREKAHRLLQEGATPPAELAGRAPLLYLVERGNSALARELVQRGAAINVRTRDGRTPLLWAVRHGDAALAEVLLENGADPNAADWQGWNPLLIALLTGQNDTALRLIQHGAKADPRPNADPGLRLAARRSTPQVVAALLERKVDPNVKAPEGTDGSTALIEAAKRGEAAIVRALLDAGAEVEARDTFGRSALAYALIWPNEYEGPDSVDDAIREAGQELGPNWIPQIIPRRSEDRDVAGVVEALVSRGADLYQRFNTYDTPGLTPLIAAAYTGNRKAVQVLLAHGARVNEVDSRGETALMMAARRTNLENIRDLLAHGANPRALDRTGRTALDHARDTGQGWGRFYQSARRTAEARAKRVRGAASQLPDRLAELEQDHRKGEAARAQIQQVLARAVGP